MGKFEAIWKDGGGGLVNSVSCSSSVGSSGSIVAVVIRFIVLLVGSGVVSLFSGSEGRACGGYNSPIIHTSGVEAGLKCISSMHQPIWVLLPCMEGIICLKFGEQET